MSNKDTHIIIGADHAGYNLKEHIKEQLYKDGYNYKDIGTFSEESMDYPDVAHPVAEAVSEGKYKYGILICGSGNGMAMTANKHKEVRAALCWDIEIARLARFHNDANILCMPGRFVDDETAFAMVQTFLNTTFEGGRHEARVGKISEC